jgi:hypothetical protein
MAKFKNGDIPVAYLRTCFDHVLYLAGKAILHSFATAPRGIDLPKPPAVDRLRAAQRIIRVACKRNDPETEVVRWQAFIHAL